MSPLDSTVINLINSFQLIHFNFFPPSIELLLICIPINLIGIFYVIFVLKEVKRANKEEIELAPGHDNPAFDNAERSLQLHEPQNAMSIDGTAVTVDLPKQRYCLLDFFNPIVAVECFKVIMRKRANQGRATVILLFLMYFIAIGPSFGEEPNEYNFTRLALNWDGVVYSTFATYGNATSLVGTIIMVIFFSKLLNVSDPLLGFMGTSCSCASRIFYVSLKYFWWIFSNFVCKLENNRKWCIPLNLNLKNKVVGRKS